MNQNKLQRQSNSETEFAYDNLTAALDETIQAAVALGVSEGELIERVSYSFSKNACHSKIVPILVPPTRKMYDSSAARKKQTFPNQDNNNMLGLLNKPSTGGAFRMKTVVMKFGGTSLMTVDRIKNAARIVSAEAANGKQIIVVVSAMGHAQLLRESGINAEIVNRFRPNPFRIFLAVKKEDSRRAVNVLAGAGC